MITNLKNDLSNITDYKSHIWKSLHLKTVFILFLLFTPLKCTWYTVQYVYNGVHSVKLNEAVPKIRDNKLHWLFFLVSFTFVFWLWVFLWLIFFFNFRFWVFFVSLGFAELVLISLYFDRFRFVVVCFSFGY